MLNRFFENEKIEYYAKIPYSLCRETAPEIMQRESFVPKSIIIFLIPYYGGETLNLSRYAAARDYHIFIREISERLIALLKAEYPENHFKAYGDHSPIDERGAAISAGLGIIGDNGLLINEKYGTYVFIADIVTDIEPDLLGAIRSPFPPRRCLHCGACKISCPTGILNGKSDSCLSEITQRKGELSDSEKALMIKYNTAWGCDECQSSCPYNKNPEITPIEFFRKDRIEELTEELLSGMSDSEFSERAFAWRKRKTVERNLKILDNK